MTIKATDEELHALDVLTAQCDGYAKAQRSTRLTLTTDLLSSLSRGLYGRSVRLVKALEALDKEGSE